jgi:L-lactate permease
VVVGFYVAALMSAAVSMVITLVFVKLSREEFDWALLNEQEST